MRYTAWLKISRIGAASSPKYEVEIDYGRLAKALTPYIQRELLALKVRGGPPFDLHNKPCRCGGGCGCPKDAA